LVAYNDKFRILETKIAENYSFIKNNEHTLDKMRECISDNTNDIKKVSFLQERIDQISGL